MQSLSDPLIDGERALLSDLKLTSDTLGVAVASKLPIWIAPLFTLSGSDAPQVASPLNHSAPGLAPGLTAIEDLTPIQFPIQSPSAGGGVAAGVTALASSQPECGI